ncbi:VOC family protein [Williamsia sp. CHRR-6]|uniref:VOC family protein n=1 Tax=Williamsia sp. CHRR-6 TaxID=2835871 RepID=UPI001BDA536C|nr:VOC family protein [Williamsia sp. CHRR-6]MBT0567611.1 VOC family protein [Williamsia sp. CHRR-6]
MTARAVIYVGDLEKMVSFYSRMFGLTRVDAETGFATLCSAEWELSLVQTPEAAPTTAPAPRRSDTAVKVGFSVVDLDATAALATALNATMDPPENRWVHRGRVLCDLVDPEGNVLSLSAPE